MTLAGWPDAAYGGQLAGGKRRLGFAIGLVSSTLKGPCHTLQWASKFTRKMVRSSLGRGVHTLSAAAEHMLLLTDFSGPFEGLNPGVAGLEDCGSLFTHLQAKKMIAEKSLVRHFSSIQQALEGGEFENAH